MLPEEILKRLLRAVWTVACQMLLLQPKASAAVTQVRDSGEPSVSAGL